MKKLALAAILALALTGCTNTAVNAPEAADSLPSAATSAPASVASKSPTVAPAWGDHAMEAFLASYERGNFSAFSDGTPHQKIIKWHASNDGVLHVEVANHEWSEATLRWLAIDIIDRASPSVEQLQKVTVSTQDQKLSRTAVWGDS